MKGVPHFTKDGTMHEGESHKMPNGELHTGKSHSDSSQKLFHFKDLSKKAQKKAQMFIDEAKKKNKKDEGKSFTEAVESRMGKGSGS